MNKVEIILFVLFVFFVDIKKTSFAGTGDMIHSNLFHDNTKSLHIAMNKLFTVLKLNKTFKQVPKIQLLLNMHNNFINIIENNHKDNEAIQNITDNIPLNDRYHVNDIMHKMSLKKMIRTFSMAGNKTMSILNVKVSKVLVAYLKDFLVKIEKLKTNVMNKFISSCTTINDKLMYVTPSMKKTKNIEADLKVWIPDKNDTNPHIKRRIFNSKKTKIKRYPFMASVHVMTEFICAGSIIKRDLVLTAASCLQSTYYSRKSIKSLGDVVVRVGSDYTTYGGQLISITDVYIHPSFDTITLRNNLAILRMDKQMLFEKRSKIRRVQYDKTGDALMKRNEIMMLGWGARDKLNTPFEFQKLSYANLDIYGLNDCKEVFSTLYVTDYNFCAGFVAKGGGACNRDVGNPAIVSDTLVGVVSFAPPVCGTPDAPTVFTKIILYAPWIESISNLKPGQVENAYQMAEGNMEQITEVQPTTPKVQPTTSEEQPTTPEIQPTTPEEDETESPLRVNKSPRINSDEEYVLREILNDLDSSNDTIMEKWIDESFKKEILDALDSTTRMDIAHHPLANKSLIPIPGIHIPQEEPSTYVTVQLTLANNSVPNLQIKNPYFIDYDEFAALFKQLQNNMANFTTTDIPETEITSPTIRTTTTRSTHFTDIDMVVDKKYINDEKISSYEYSENYEFSEYEKELSIEYTTSKVLEEPTLFFTLRDSEQVDAEGSFENGTIETTTTRTKSTTTIAFTETTSEYTSNGIYEDESIETIQKETTTSQPYVDVRRPIRPAHTVSDGYDYVLVFKNTRATPSEPYGYNKYQNGDKYQHKQYTTKQVTRNQIATKKHQPIPVQWHPDKNFRYNEISRLPRYTQNNMDRRQNDDEKKKKLASNRKNVSTTYKEENEVRAKNNKFAIGPIRGISKSSYEEKSVDYKNVEEKINNRNTESMKTSTLKSEQKIGVAEAISDDEFDYSKQKDIFD